MNEYENQKQRERTTLGIAGGVVALIVGGIVTLVKSVANNSESDEMEALANVRGQKVQERNDLQRKLIKTKTDKKRIRELNQEITDIDNRFWK